MFCRFLLASCYQMEEKRDQGLGEAFFYAYYFHGEKKWGLKLEHI